MNISNYLRVWLSAIRPKTLGAAVSPILIGTAMAFGEGKGHALAALAALLGALLIQIGTNFSNDYFDYIKGADTEERLGPVRVTQSGKVRPKTMLWNFVMVFGLATLVGIYLVFRGGWPIVIIGILSNCFRNTIHRWAMAAWLFGSWRFICTNFFWSCCSRRNLLCANT